MPTEAFSPQLARLLSPDAAPERVATGFRFTEGPLWDPDTREKATKLSGRLWLARMMFSRIDSLRALAAARLMVS